MAFAFSTADKNNGPIKRCIEYMWMDLYIIIYPYLSYDHLQRRLDDFLQCFFGIQVGVYTPTPVDSLPWVLGEAPLWTAAGLVVYWHATKTCGEEEFLGLRGTWVQSNRLAGMWEWGGPAGLLRMKRLRDAESKILNTYHSHIYTLRKICQKENILIYMINALRHFDWFRQLRFSRTK